MAIRNQIDAGILFDMQEKFQKEIKGCEVDIETGNYNSIGGYDPIIEILILQGKLKVVNKIIEALE